MVLLEESDLKISKAYVIHSLSLAPFLFFPLLSSLPLTLPPFPSLPFSLPPLPFPFLCFILVDQGVSSQLLPQHHAFLPVVMLPSVMVIVLPFKTVRFEHIFLLPTALVMVSYHSDSGLNDVGPQRFTVLNKLVELAGKD